MAKWTIDPMHSEVQFKVKHLVISTVTGSFKKFEGTAEASADDFGGAAVTFSADADSIDTNQEQRDGHLKSPDFLDTAAHPKMTFVSTSMVKTSGNNFSLKGDLTIKGTTHPVELSAEYGGSAADSYGNYRSGFEVTGTINRKDYGLTWSGVTEAGNIILGEDVKIIANIQLIKQA